MVDVEQEFAGIKFALVGAVDPERDAAGRIAEFMPQSRYAKAAITALNPHGIGPFCRFSIARGMPFAGVYVLTVDDAPVYVGKCVDLSKRWGGNGYGAISPKNCFIGGQSTNCKVNNRILRQKSSGHRIHLWFHRTDDSSSVERAVITELNPEWNAQVPW